MLELVARVQAGRQLLVVGAQGDAHADPWRQGSATQFVIVSRDSSDDSRTGVNICVV